MSLDPDDDDEKKSKYLESKWGGLASVLLDDCASTFKLEEQDANTQYILGFLKELEEARRTDYGDFLTLMSTRRLDETSQNRLNSRLYDQLAWSFQQPIPMEQFSSTIYEGHVEAFRWLSFDVEKGMEFGTEFVKQALATPNYRDEIFRDLVPYCTCPPKDISVETLIINNRNASAFRIWLDLSKRQGVYTDSEWQLLLSKACSAAFEEGIEIILPRVPYTWLSSAQFALKSGVSLKRVQALADKRIDPQESQVYYSLLRFVADETKGNLLLTWSALHPSQWSVMHFLSDWFSRKDMAKRNVLHWRRNHDFMARFFAVYAFKTDNHLLGSYDDTKWPPSLLHQQMDIHLLVFEDTSRLPLQLYHDCRRMYPNAIVWIIDDPPYSMGEVVTPIRDGTVKDEEWTVVQLV